MPAWTVILGMIGYVLAPTLATAHHGRPARLGPDGVPPRAHRKTLLDYHQFPFWQPYACGGHPNWGGFESGTTIVSPWLPFYLPMTLPHAMRVEIWGSALLSAVGAWLLASRFTRSPALAGPRRGGLRGRTAAGPCRSCSGPHLAPRLRVDALDPLLLRPRRGRRSRRAGAPRRRDVVLAAACIAMMVYTGGIYPLPETIFVVALYGVAPRARDALRRGRSLARRWRAAGGAGAGRAQAPAGARGDAQAPAPGRLDRDHRPERARRRPHVARPGHLRAATRASASGGGTSGACTSGGRSWRLVAAGRARRARARASRRCAWTGVLVLRRWASGSFHKYAPWPLLHHFPVFQSQHVPSRWMYPALLLLLAVTAAAARARPAADGRGARVARARGSRGRGVDGARRREGRAPAHAHMFATQMPRVRRLDRPVPHRAAPARDARLPERLGARVADRHPRQRGHDRLRHVPRAPQLLPRPQRARPGLGAHGVGRAGSTRARRSSPRARARPSCRASRRTR